MVSSKNTNSSNPRKIAIKLPNWLGDMVMSLSFVAACQKVYPKACIDLIVAEKLADFPFPANFRIIKHNKKNQLKFGLSLRKEKYQQFWVLPLSFSAALMARLSAATISIGYKSEGRSWLLTHSFKHDLLPRQKHMAFEMLDLIALFKKSPIDYNYPELIVKRQLSSANFWKNNKITKGKYILAAPFAAYGPAKGWPLDNFKSLLSDLKKIGQQVVIVGLAKDKPIAAGFQGCVNMAGKTSLAQLTALIQHAKLVLSLDSGVSHLAAALKVKQVVIFGSTSPIWTKPLNDQAKIIYKQEHCSPCYRRTCPYGHYNCFQRIGVTEVKQAVADLLFE